MVGAAFAVADDHEARTGVLEHRRGNIAGMRAAVRRVAILRADADKARFLMGRVDQRVRRREATSALISRSAARSIERASESIARVPHLPIADDIGALRHRNPSNKSRSGRRRRHLFGRSPLVPAAVLVKTAFPYRAKLCEDCCRARLSGDKAPSQPGQEAPFIPGQAFLP